MYSIAIREEASGCGGKKFVTLNAGSNAPAPIVRFDAEHTSIAADMDVTGKRNLLGKRENELDRAACFDSGFHKKVEPPEAAAARFALHLRNAVSRLEANLDRKHHRKPPCRAAFYGRFHYILR